MAVTIGAKAPEFTLPDQDKHPVSVSDLAGHKALIVFIPFPFTGICESELCTIRDHLAQLGDLDAKVVVVTTHAVPTNKRWADDNDFAFPVLSDYWPHGEVARAYDAFNEQLGCANRRTIVLDADGVVRDIIETDSLGTPREYDAYVEALQGI